MKKLSLILASVLLCTLVFAGGTGYAKSTTASSAAAVTNVAGSKIVKVYYQSDKQGKVKVSIIDSGGEEIFNELVPNTNGFIRPYNFEFLPQGEYTVVIKDEYGKMVEKITYAEDRIEKQINIKKLREADKYLVTIASAKKDDMTILISDSADNLIYHEAVTVEGNFGRVYKIKNLPSFSINVIDSKGTVKSVKY